MATEAGESGEAVRAWLEAELKPFFTEEGTRQVLFKAWFAVMIPLP